MTQKDTNDIVYKLNKFREWLAEGMQAEDLAWQANHDEVRTARHDGASKAYEQSIREFDRKFANFLDR